MRDSESEKNQAAELIYKKIEGGTKNTKTKNVLKRIKEACDFYEGEHIPISMARVGRYWEQRGGGVHAQSIRNNLNSGNTYWRVRQQCRSPDSLSQAAERRPRNRATNTLFLRKWNDTKLSPRR